MIVSTVRSMVLLALPLCREQHRSFFDSDAVCHLAEIARAVRGDVRSKRKTPVKPCLKPGGSRKARLGRRKMKRAGSKAVV